MTDNALPRTDRPATMPMDVSHRLGTFDRFASAAASYTAGRWFFAGCLVLVLLWAPTIIVVSFDTWDLIINTATSIITFLLVALLQNTQTRADAAAQHKLNAIAQALSGLMHHIADDDPELRRQCDELRAAVGLEREESA